MNTTTKPIPTGGVARRRAKAIRNRQAVAESAERIASRPPWNATSVVGCSCGWVAWLGPDPTAEDRDWLHQQSEDHDYLCSEVDA